MSDPDQLADLPVNDEGTHVATLSPSHVPWGCPLGYLNRALQLGYTVVRPAPADVPPGLFDPGTHTVDQVNTHLAAAFAREDLAEIERVLAAEAAGQSRKTITDPTAGTPGDHA